MEATHAPRGLRVVRSLPPEAGAASVSVFAEAIGSAGVRVVVAAIKTTVAVEKEAKMGPGRWAPVGWWLLGITPSTGIT